MTGAIPEDAQRRSAPLSVQGILNVIALLVLTVLSAWIILALANLHLIMAAKIYGGMVITEMLWMAFSVFTDPGDPVP